MHFKKKSIGREFSMNSLYNSPHSKHSPLKVLLAFLVSCRRQKKKKNEVYDLHMKVAQSVCLFFFFALPQA